MPKMLIIAACLINYGDERGGVDHEVGDMPDVPTKATATFLADTERALYIDKRDDHNRDGRYTASEKMIAAAKALAKSKAAPAPPAT